MRLRLCTPKVLTGLRLMVAPAQIASAVSRGLAKSQVSVAVRPEQSARVGDNQIMLKIRLATGRTASVWAGRVCSEPSGEMFVVRQSGSDQIPPGTVMNKNAQNGVPSFVGGPAEKRCGACSGNRALGSRAR